VTLVAGLGLVASGALLALDHAAWPSLLLAQPLVAGALAGALTGHVEAGIAAGAVVQMLFLGVLPVGGATPGEAWLGGIAAAICAPAGIGLGSPAWLDDPRLAAPAIAGVGAAYAGRGLLILQRRRQRRIARQAHDGLLAGDVAAATRAVRFGIGLHAARGVLGVLLVLLLAPPCVALLERLGCDAPAGRIALALAAVTLAAFGRRRGRTAWLVAGLALGGAAAWLRA
jgi:mannose/fructose/N-acetylgalactosamine-specific phosphotransferase system component IIC